MLVLSKQHTPSHGTLPSPLSTHCRSRHPFLPPCMLCQAIWLRFRQQRVWGALLEVLDKLETELIKQHLKDSK